MEEERTGAPLLKTIARYEGDCPEKFGVPRQSGRAALTGRIVFEKEYSVPEALRGLDGFSHIWLLWGFSLEKSAGWSPTVRPPRLGGNKRMGVFATRSPNRPNSVGLSAVKLTGAGKENGRLFLEVEGADLVCGTPIYDVKPYLPSCDSIPGARGGWAESFTDYALDVDFPKELLLKIPENKRDALTGVLREDPRPAYQSAKETYGLSFAGYNVSFFVDEKATLHVTDITRQKEKNDEMPKETCTNASDLI